MRGPASALRDNNARDRPFPPVYVFVAGEGKGEVRVKDFPGRNDLGSRFSCFLVPAK